MRRKDREVKELTDILAILERCKVARLALCDDYKPYVIPLNFGYELVNNDVFIYFHCAVQGRKIDIIKKNNFACFEADCLLKVVGGEVACDWTANFESVIGEGTIEIVDTLEEKEKGLDSIMRQCGFEGKPTYSEKSLTGVTVLKLTLDSISGKRRN